MVISLVTSLDAYTSQENNVNNAFGQPQNVIVFGASSDIARAITKKLCAARTRHLVLAGRDEGRLAVAAEEALEYGATSTTPVLFDASDPASAHATVQAAFAACPDGVDLVIIAVGQLGDQVSDQVDAGATLVGLNVNFTWPAAALAAIRQHLVEQRSGRILVISSVAGVRVRASAYLYGGAKAGLDRLCDAMADSLEGTGVSMQILRPGLVRTKMTTGLAPVPFTTGANEVATYVMKGLATGQRIIWSPPILRYVYFALRHLPRQVWRAVMDR